MRVKIREIKVHPGRREIAPEHTDELAKSIAELGLLNPITVDSSYTLIAGLHRLEAAKRLGWTEIECTVSSLEGLQAELAEIDENFVRKDLSSVEYGDLLLRRKEIYEAIHPEARNGGDRRSEDFRTTKCRSEIPRSFVQDTASKLGVAPRTVERQIQTAKKLTPEAKEILRHSDVSKKNTSKVSHLPPGQQEEAASLLAAGKIKSVDEYDAWVEKVRNSEGKAVQTDKSPSDPPYSLGSKRYATIKESVADLKDPNKDCSCTPDSFLAEIDAFVQKFKQEIEWFQIPYYEPALPGLTQAQLDFFLRQMGLICDAAHKLTTHVKEGWSNHGQKA